MSAPSRPYSVSVTEWLRLEISVEAANADEALAQAKAAYVRGDFGSFRTTGNGFDDWRVIEE